MFIINHFKKLWRGEESFWKVFWLWGVLGNITWFYCAFVLSHYIHVYKEVGILRLLYVVFYIPMSVVLILKNLENTRRRMLSVFCGLVIGIFVISFYTILYVTWQLTETSHTLLGLFKYIM